MGGGVQVRHSDAQQKNTFEGGHGSQALLRTKHHTLACVMEGWSVKLSEGPAKRARLNLPGEPSFGKESNGSLGHPATHPCGDSRLPGLAGLPDSDGHVSHKDRPASRPQPQPQLQLEGVELHGHRGHKHRRQGREKSSQRLGFSAEAAPPSPSLT